MNIIITTELQRSRNLVPVAQIRALELADDEWGTGLSNCLLCISPCACADCGANIKRKRGEFLDKRLVPPSAIEIR